MRSFRNNQKRIRNRNANDRPFKRSNDINRLNSDFGNRENGFRRKNNRNNGNVEKLITKYNELAREALSNGDKILSENYLQHADHFMRILNERESFKRERSLEEKSDENEKEINELPKNVDVSEKNLKDNSNLDTKAETPAEAN